MMTQLTVENVTFSEDYTSANYRGCNVFKHNIVQKQLKYFKSTKKKVLSHSRTNQNLSSKTFSSLVMTVYVSGIQSLIDETVLSRRHIREFWRNVTVMRRCVP